MCRGFFTPRGRINLEAMGWTYRDICKYETCGNEIIGDTPIQIAPLYQIQNFVAGTRTFIDVIFLHICMMLVHKNDKNVIKPKKSHQIGEIFYKNFSKNQGF